MTMTAVFERLTSRVRQRKETAQERIEGAAAAVAGGQTIDIAGLEEALRDAGLTVDDFRDRVQFHDRRRDHLARLEKLAVSRTRAQKLEKQLAAEEAKHAEIVAAYQKRWAGIRDEADTARRDVSAATDSRDWLLHPDNAPLPLVDKYRAALDQEETAVAAVAAAERDIRSLREQIAGEAGWLEQIAGEDQRTIHPPEASLTKRQRDKLTGQAARRYQEHEERKARLERRLVEAEKTLEDARAALASAEAAVAAIRKTILAA